VKRGSNKPKNKTFKYFIYAKVIKNPKVVFGRCSKIISSTQVHSDFGDVLYKGRWWWQFWDQWHIWGIHHLIDDQMGHLKWMLLVHFRWWLWIPTHQSLPCVQSPIYEEMPCCPSLKLIVCHGWLLIIITLKWILFYTNKGNPLLQDEKYKV